MFKPVFLKQFRQFHFLKPLDIFMRLLKYVNKVASRDAKEDVDKIRIEAVQKTSDKAGGKPTLVSHFNRENQGKTEKNAGKQGEKVEKRGKTGRIKEKHRKTRENRGKK